MGLYFILFIFFLCQSICCFQEERLVIRGLDAPFQGALQGFSIMLHDIFSCSLIFMHRHNIITLQDFNALTSSYICVTALPSAV